MRAKFTDAILLIEPDRAERAPIVDLLHRGGWTCIQEAEHGESALRLIEDAHTLPIVIIGSESSASGESDVCQRLKTEHPGLLVLEITANNNSRTNADAVVLKPVREAEFASQLRCLLRIRRTELHSRSIETLLRHSEQRFRSTFENAAVGIGQVAPDGTWLGVNSRLCQITGYSRDELLVRTCMDITHPDDLEADVESANRLRAGEISSYKMEKRYICKNGESVWVNLTVGCVRNETGALDHFVSVTEDISERKRAEEALRDSEQRLALAFGAGNIGIYDYDVRSKKALNWDAKVCHLWGVAPDEFMSDDIFWTGVHPDDIAAIEKAVAQGLDPDGPRRYRSEYRVTSRADGVTRWVHVEAAVLFEERKPVRIIGTVQDITGPRNFEQELDGQRRLYKSVTDNASLALFIMDAHQQCLFLNPAAEQLTGFTLEELRGRPLHDMIHHTRPDGSPYPLSECPIDQAFPKNDRETGEEVFVHKDGHFYTVRFTASPIRDGHSVPTGTVIEVEDITEQKRDEERLRASEARFRGVYEHAPTGIAITDMNGRFLECNPAYAAMLGYTEEELRDLTFADLVYPEDRAANLEEIRQLARQDRRYFEILNRYVRKDGEIVWAHKFVMMLYGQGGQPTNIVALVTDMTARITAEEQIRFLLREVNHRSKNLLAVVQAVANQTAQLTDPVLFAQQFSERLQGLAASHDLLVHNSWQGVALDDLLISQLAHFNDLIGKRIRLSGPPLRLTASAAQTLGMAFHELATNAGKYGALSGDSGKLTIEWELELTQEPPVVTILWTESGCTIEPPASSGFGSRVTIQMVKMALGAEVRREFPASGLIWEARAPAKSILEPMQSHGSEPVELTGTTSKETLPGA